MDTSGRSTSSLRGLSCDRLNLPSGESSIPARSDTAWWIPTSMAAYSSLMSRPPSSNSSSAPIRTKSETCVAVKMFHRLATNPASSVAPSTRSQRACASA